MNPLSQTLSLKETTFSLKREWIDCILYSLVSFAIPFAFGQPQIVIGSIVNCALILTALNLKNHRIFPVILLPSVAVFSRGLIFGPFTIFLVYTMPFIWLGNSLLVLSVKHLYLSLRLNKYLSVAFGILIKVFVLYVSALILIHLEILPKVFATSMGMLQLITACIGSIMALGIQQIINKKSGK